MSVTPLQADGGDGCLWGCGLALASLPLVVILQHFEERNKRKVERLEEETQVLRLEAEKERLLAERADAAAERKRRKMTAAGYVLCPACEQWRDKLGEDGVCEPCEIEAEIADVIDE